MTATPLPATLDGRQPLRCAVCDAPILRGKYRPFVHQPGARIPSHEAVPASRRGDGSPSAVASPSRLTSAPETRVRLRTVGRLNDTAGLTASHRAAASNGH